MLDTQLTEYAIKGLEAEIAALDTKRTMLVEQLQALQRGINGRTKARRPSTAMAPPAATKRRRPTISAEGRQRIAEAQRARWAKSKATARKAAKAVGKPTTTDDVKERRLVSLTKARQAKAAKKAAAASPETPEREIARPPMPRHVKAQRLPQQAAQEVQA